MTTKLRAALLLAAVLIAGGASQAPAQQGEQRQTFELRLTANRPTSSTGFSERIDYVNPADPEAKPLAVERIVVRLPVGTKIDTKAPEQCRASDTVLISQGADACPPASRIGQGLVDLDTGVAGPGRIVSNDVTLLNHEDEVIFIFEEKGSGGRVVSRAKVAGRSFTTEAPPLPGGPPDGFAAIDRVLLDVEAVARGRASYITTPESCPTSGGWISSGTFTYRDGVAQTVEAVSPCRGRRGRGGSGGLGRCSNGKRGSASGENLRGTRRGDRLWALGGRDRVLAFAGGDCVLGGAGDDVVDGGRGPDNLKGQRGADRFRGDSGQDDIRGNGGRDVLNGGAGRDRLLAGRDRDLIRAADGTRDVVRCGRGRDRAIVDRRDRVRGCERVKRR